MVYPHQFKLISLGFPGKHLSKGVKVRSNCGTNCGLTNELFGVSNRVAVSEQIEPSWLQQFPISVDYESIHLLLVAFVREASRQAKLEMAYPVVVSRAPKELVDTNSYALYSSSPLARAI